MENIVRRIDVKFDHNGDPLSCEFFLVGYEFPYSVEEFVEGSYTRKHLEEIENLILYGTTSEGVEW